MKEEGVDAYVEALLNDRSPKPLRSPPEELPVLRSAIALRASEAPLTVPDHRFVERLHRQLAGDAQGSGSHTGRGEAVESGGARRLGRVGSVGKVAAAILLVAWTLGAGAAVSRHSPGSGAPPSSGATTVRSGELRSADGRWLGRTYAYRGTPSWVFMDVRGGGLSGLYTCELNLANGTVVPEGEVAVYNGTGDWGHTVAVDVSQLRQAVLVGPSGAPVATATFR